MLNAKATSNSRYIYSTRMKSRDLIKAKSAERTAVREHFERISKPGSSFGFCIIQVYSIHFPMYIRIINFLPIG
jgi:hypothetical protein